MINRIYNLLQEDIPLPQCLQLIGLLRSMCIFTESELRLKFIQARDISFQALLKTIPKDNCKTVFYT